MLLGITTILPSHLVTQYALFSCLFPQHMTLQLSSVDMASRESAPSLNGNGNSNRIRFNFNALAIILTIAVAASCLVTAAALPLMPYSQVHQTSMETSPMAPSYFSDPLNLVPANFAGRVHADDGDTFPTLTSIAFEKMLKCAGGLYCRAVLVFTTINGQTLALTGVIIAATGGEYVSLPIDPSTQYLVSQTTKAEAVALMKTLGAKATAKIPNSCEVDADAAADAYLKSTKAVVSCGDTKLRICTNLEIIRVC